ncbi:hypothetical protein PTI98_007186 [Pleurotus ostreatus]|nr:hypothetical protein PTI98_007186 [Pleurotus ostreatus]
MRQALSLQGVPSLTNIRQDSRLGSTRHPKGVGYWGDTVHGLNDYLNTLGIHWDDGDHKFLDENLVDVFKQQAGQDSTKSIEAVMTKMNPAEDAEVFRVELPATRDFGCPRGIHGPQAPYCNSHA